MRTHALVRKPQARSLGAPAAPRVAPGRKARGQAADIRHILGRRTVEPKLKIGAPNDVYEREADGVADQVMGMAGPDVAPAIDGSPPAVQRLCDESAEELQTELAGAEQVQHQAERKELLHRGLASPGQPLDQATRTFFELRLRHDLRGVRIHTGAAADQLARHVSAKAYTVGHNVVFARNQFAPNTNAGRRLITHELAHVLQQAKGCASDAPRHSHLRPGSGVTSLAPAVRPDRSGALRRIPIEGLPPKTDLANERMRALDRQRAGGEPGPGLPWKELKKAGYDYLIEQVSEGREWYIGALREQVSTLPAGLQPAALSLVELVAVDLMLLTDLFFLELALIVGIGEGVVEMITGLLTIILKIFEVAWHYVLAAIYGVQQELAKLELSDQPSEDLIRPLAEDLTAAEMLWHDILYFDLFGYLEDWGDKFLKSSQEEKAIMAGDFVADLVLFIATWEASAGRIGKFRIPPPPAAAPTPVLALAGGGSMPMAAGRTAAGVSVRTGGPIGGIGSTVTRMAGRGDSLPDQTARGELSGKDGEIIDTAIVDVGSAADPFVEHVQLLKESVAAHVPGGKVYNIGTLDERTIMGSRFTGVGIVKIPVDDELLTYVVKLDIDDLNMHLSLEDVEVIGLFE
jgi:hypothetical protein